MKKKNYDEDSDNEFEVDEPEELQENSDDEWAPVKGANKRSSTGPKRGTPSKKKKKDSDDEDEEDLKNKKKGNKAKTPTKGKSKAKGKSKDDDEDDDDLNEEEIEDEELDDEEVDDDEEEEEEEEEETVNDGSVGTPKEFSSGAFVVLKSDFNNTDDPPIWKIDGKALLQKYIPYEQNGKTLYKNTSVYSGWTINKKDQYYPATVIFKQQSRKEHVVEFQRDLIQKEDIPVAD